MKRLYLCAMLLLVCILAFSGYTQAQEANVSGIVWADDGDGIRQTTEPGLKDVTVTVHKISDDTQVGEAAVTKNNGTYSFTKLPAGVPYYVKFTLLPGYTFTLWQQGTDQALDSDANPGTGDIDQLGKTLQFTLVDKVDLVFDAGMKQAVTYGSISGHVWDDLDKDGIRDTGEPGIVGENVTLKMPGKADVTVKTAAEGYYIFENVLAGSNYNIEFTLKTDYDYSPKDNNAATEEFDSDARNNGQTDNFDISAGQNKTFVDAGMYQKAVYGNISGHVWHDIDNDGIREPGNGESGISDVNVILKMPGNQELNGQTDANGFYTIHDVPSGKNYHIEFLMANGYDSYSSGENSTEAGEEFDSDVDKTGITADFDMASGENKTFVDAGIFKMPVLNGLFWNDLNNNGTKDPGEEGIQKSLGAEIYKCGTTTDPFYTWGTTDGTFGLWGLLPGSYYMVFDVPDGDVVTYLPFTNTLNQSGRTDCFTVKSGDVINANAGLHLSAYSKVKGYGWNDLNKDGYWDDNEPALEGLEVILQMPDKPDLKTTTDVHGYFMFENVLSGQNYIVKYSLKKDYQFSPVVESKENKLNSTVNPSDGTTSPFTLIGGDEFYSFAGMFLPNPPDDNPNPQINGILWVDANGDGFQGGVTTEPGLGGWTVNLLGADQKTIIDSRITSTLTDPGQTGRYAFTHLSAGTYYIQFVNPGGYTFTLQNAVNDNRDSDVNPDGLSGPVEITNNARDEHVDAGVYKNDEPPGGNAKISGRLWDDSYNKDGLQDALSYEPGLGGQLVELYLSDGTLYKSMNTKSTGGDGDIGTYMFENVAVGSYYVKFYLPAVFTFTVKDAGNDQLDSDADQTTGQTDNISVTKNAEITHIDAGAIYPEAKKGSIGDYVWLDVNGNGQQDNGEPGVYNVQVDIYYFDGNSWGFMGFTSTDENGKYLFTVLPAGSYKLHFNAPSGYKFTARNGAITTENNSDADPTPGADYGYTVIFQLDPLKPPIDNITYVDAGLIQTQKGSIGDLVWNDKDCDGIQDLTEKGVGYVVVKLYAYDNGHSEFIKETMTDQYGGYSFTGLEAGTYRVRFILPGGYEQFTIKDAEENNYDKKDSDADPDGWTDPINLSAGENDDDLDAGLCKTIGKNACIGDFVWKDCDGDGIQDKDEPGIPKVKVELYKWDSNDVLKSTTTNADGKYYFENVEPGSYYVKFILADGMKFTLKDQGTNDALDSDADTKTGKTDKIILAGVNNFTIDAGMLTDLSLLANLGDLVWNDCNRNGIQDGGETGMEGVEVKLHVCTSDHKNPTDPRLCGNVVAAAKTDKTGKYMFTNIMPGYYCVEIVVPCKFTITKPDQTDDWKDSDVIPSMRHTGCINLKAGETNNTVDAGLYPTPPATIGDLVWIDANKNGIQDQGEKGLCNVNIELYMCGVTKPVAAAKTDSDGKYIFKNVISGTSYSVKFYLPKGYAFTSMDEGNNDNFDSDVCAKECSGMTRYYDLMPDETNLTIDAGMYLATITACNYVWKDNNNNGVKDESEQGIPGVSVELYQCSNNTLVQSVKTDASGLFTFNNIPLESYYLQIIVPDGFKIGKAAQNGGSQDVNGDFGINGQSSCFDVTEGTTSIGKPVALVLSTTGVTRGSEIPTEFSLQQNYPNPFNPSTTIEFAVPSAGQYTLKVFNMLGQEVATLLDRELPLGYHMVTFDASRMPSGMYIYRLSGSNIIMTKKMMLSK